MKDVSSDSVKQQVRLTALWEIKVWAGASSAPCLPTDIVSRGRSHFSQRHSAPLCVRMQQMWAGWWYDRLDSLESSVVLMRIKVQLCSGTRGHTCDNSLSPWITRLRDADSVVFTGEEWGQTLIKTMTWINCQCGHSFRKSLWEFPELAPPSVPAHSRWTGSRLWMLRMLSVFR